MRIKHFLVGLNILNQYLLLGLWHMRYAIIIRIWLRGVALHMVKRTSCGM